MFIISKDFSDIYSNFHELWPLIWIIITKFIGFSKLQAKRRTFYDKSFGIQRAHRLGAPRRDNIGQHASRPRPIIVCFSDFKMKENIRSKRYSLTAPFGIANDLPLAVRNAQKSLIPQLREGERERDWDVTALHRLVQDDHLGGKRLVWGGTGPRKGDLKRGKVWIAIALSRSYYWPMRMIASNLICHSNWTLLYNIINKILVR